jgi:hypothetical protein
MGPSVTQPYPRSSWNNLVFVACLAGLGVLATLSAIPSVFSIDDGNYLVNVVALREGAVTVANTAGLPPSNELLAFDPGPSGRRVLQTPVASTAPPLYAPIALPFSLLGLRGLIGLNTMAYLATVAVVFLIARRFTQEPVAAWVGASAVALGGFTFEYAVGIWPHALSLGLTTGAFAAASLCLGTTIWRPAAVAGLLLGIAAGLRYQNAVLLLAAGTGLFVWSRARLKALPAFAVAASIPLALSALINYIRLDSWNPVSKGPGYLAVVVPGAAGSWGDPFVMFWSRMVDFSARPPVDWLLAFSTYDRDTGAFLMLGVTVKKAVLQSAPWALVGGLVLVLAWVRRGPVSVDQRRLLMFLSIPAAALVGVFALAGVGRDDGLSFNQRYLLELLPLAAVALAIGIDGLSVRARPLAMASAIGVVAAALVLLWGPISAGPDGLVSAGRQLLILKVPLGLAVLSSATWVLVSLRRAPPAILAVSLGLCLGWGFSLHMLEDVTASQRLRARNLATTRQLEQVVPTNSALVTYWGAKDAAIPLVMTLDVIILDTQADEGRDAPKLIQALLAQNRRVFFLESGFPPDVRARALAGVKLVRLPETYGLPIFEVQRGDAR